MLMRLVLFLVYLICSLAPSWASERHYDIRVSLDPVTRVLDAHMRVTVPPTAEGRFDLSRDFTLQALAIDGQTMDLAAESWPLPTGRPAEIAFRATLPTLDTARASRTLMPFADPEGSFLPLVGWHRGLAVGDFTYDVTVDVPSEQRAVVPGRLVEEGEAAGRYTVRFAFDKPAREVPVFAGPYVVGETMRGGIRRRTYFPKNVDHLGDHYRRQVARYIDIFSSRIGSYPHDEFHVVASPLPVGLGFPTLTYVSRQILHLPFMQERSLAHEVLHAWWGHAVAVDYGRGNWSEALTTFMADYALAEMAGDAEALEMRRGWLADFTVLPAAQDRPIVSFVVRDHAASQVIGYSKGAMLFVMLRDEIGVPAFQAGLRRFWREQQFQVAAWSDLQAAFEAEVRRPLDAFFRQWLERTGAPQITLRGVERTQAGPVKFSLTQLAPPYQLAVPVLIETVNGAERHVVHLDTVEQHYALRPVARATALHIDPDYRLFRRLSLEEVTPIIRSLIVAPNAVTIVAGAGSAVAEAGRDVATRLLEAGWRPSELAKAMEARAPLLLVGTTPAVLDALVREGLPPRPNRLGDRGTARVWTTRYNGDVPLLVVEGLDVDALRQSATAIRHHGASSYLVFEGSNVVDRGVWPPTGRPLQVQFKD
jgi:aminopeptidase N